MPPRKKAKPAPSTPIAYEDSMLIDSPTPKVTQSKEPPEPKYDILKDPWTDEQESSLFKGLMRWKPNGMHKHFRMVALSEYLRNHGYDPQIETHTRIPGIWQKLGTLYNMRVIDDRENSFEYEEDIKDKYHEFELPPDEYDEITFMRGKRDSPSEESEAGSSPPGLGRSPSPPVAQATRKRKRGDTVTNAKTRASTIDDTDEARTSPVHSPTAKTTRSGRSANRSAGRVAADSISRHQSRETTIDEETRDVEEEEEAEEEGEEDEQETEEEESNSLKASKATSRSKADPPATRKSRRKK